MSVEPPPPRTTPKDIASQRIVARVRPFLDALREAVHDAEHEVNGDAKLIHFWDWGSLELAVRGRDELAHRLADGREITESDLVEALYSAGFLGPVAMLRAHRAEFLSALSVWRGQATQSDTRRRKHEFETLRQLTDLLASHEDLTEGTISDALAILGTVNYQDFVRIQAESGSWQRRLGRLIDDDAPLLNLGEHGDSLRDLSVDPYFDEFARRIEEIAPKRATKLSIAMDAAALTSLARMNEKAPDLQEKLYPRFFSSSPTLSRLMQDDWVRARLRFPTQDGSVWRNAQYYMVRALFPVLRLGLSSTEAAIAIGPTLAELRGWSDQLHEALSNASSREVQELVNTMIVDETGDGSLLDLANDLTESRLTRVWLQYSPRDIPPAFRQTLEGLYQLQADERASAAADLIVREAADRFEEEVQEVRTATKLVRAVESELREYVRRTNKDSVSLKLDLVSPRWGVEYSGARDVVVVGVGNGDRGYGAILRQFDIPTLKSHPDETLRYAAILLGIEQFELAGELLEVVGHEDATVRHRLMAHVSRLGRRFVENDLNEIVVDAHVRELVREWDELPSHTRPSLANGFGYAALLAWQLSAYGGAQLEGLGPRDSLGVASWSVSIVEDEFDRMTQLGKLHADNHVLYATASLGKHIDITGPMFERLRAQVETHPNFRFLDTLGFVLLRHVTRRIRDGENWSDSLRGLLQSARSYLQRAAQLFPNDLEVRRHLAEANHLDPSP